MNVVFCFLSVLLARMPFIKYAHLNYPGKKEKKGMCGNRKSEKEDDDGDGCDGGFHSTSYLNFFFLRYFRSALLA